MSRETVVFFHAHPDDESIFTGGTICLLAGVGVRTVVVIATSDHIRDVRTAEADEACRILGVDAVHHLGYTDSGSSPPVTTGGGIDRSRIMDRFHEVPTEQGAARLAEILRAERATALVTYDDGGIYAHPDHLAVHRVGALAADLAGVGVRYEATVDREYLHFVETHLVGHAVEWLVGPDARAVINRAPVGVPTVMLSTTIDVRAVIDRKRDAIVAHRSQVPPTSDLHAMDAETFAAVYGYEWFVRRGPAGPIERFAI